MRVFFGSSVLPSLLFFCILNNNVLIAQERLFWANDRIGILSSNKDGSDLDTIIRNEIAGFSSISIDTANQKIYWVDRTNKQFGTMNYDGTSLNKEFTVESQSPGNLYLEPFENKLYWYDYTANNFWKANLDGSQMEFVSNALPGANNPEYIVDKSKELIYWWNPSENKIQSLNLTNQNIEDVVVGSQDTFIIEFRIDFVNSKIYWLTFETNYSKELKRMNLDGSQAETIFSYQYDHLTLSQEFEIDPPNDRLILVHKPTYNSAEHVLIGNLDGSNLGIHGYLLSINNRNFHFDGQTDDFFCIGDNTHGVYNYHIDGSTSIVTHLTFDSFLSPRGIAVDHQNGKIYWTDSVNDKIQRCNLDGSGIEVLVRNAFLNPRLSDPGALALDLTENYLYWVDKGHASISRIRTDGNEEEEVVISNLFIPQGLALDTINQKIYFTQQGQVGIYRSNMDGTELEKVISIDALSQGAPDQLAIDLEQNQIYWSSLKLGIARANLDGSNIDTVLQINYGGDSGLALDIDNEHIYWIVDSTLQRLNFDGSGNQDIVTGLAIAGSVGGYLTFNATHAYQSNLEHGSYCEEDELSIEGIHNTNTIDWAFDALNSTATIPSGKTVHYKAGNIIRMLPGFSAQNGSQFRAKIETCAPSLPPEIVSSPSLNSENNLSANLNFQLFPNPANQSTRIEWTLLEENEVQINLYSMTGSFLSNLMPSQSLPKGQSSLDIDLSELGVGMYIIVLQTNDAFHTKRLVVSK